MYNINNNKLIEKECDFVLKKIICFFFIKLNIYLISTFFFFFFFFFFVLNGFRYIILLNYNINCFLINYKIIYMIMKKIIILMGCK